MLKNQFTTILLCGGKGSRMRSNTTHKVCFDINGQASILRTLNNYQDAGIRSFCIVLGSMAGNVMECIGQEFDNVCYSYQKDPLGTAHATMCGVRSLQTTGYKGSVMIGMGDKIIHPDFIRKLMEEYGEDGNKVVIASQDKKLNPHGGRLVRRSDGSILGIIEEKDVNAAAEAGRMISVNGEDVSPAAVEQTDSVNAALYIMPFDFLLDALNRLEASSATGEYYLPDVVNLACSERGMYHEIHVSEVRCDNASHVLGFNTVDELLHVEHVLKGQEERNTRSERPLRTASQWLQLIDGKSKELTKKLEAIYGSDEDFLEKRIGTLRNVLNRFSLKHGADRDVIIVRAPGRVNLMGRHVEHRGGDINVISINREILCVASLSHDRMMHISNVNEQYEDSSFSINDYLSVLKWQDWVDFVNSGEAQRLVRDSSGHWENYVKAALLRLQHRYPSAEIMGMDMVFSGDIPRAAGLSSSSAIVVATAEAAIRLSDIDVTPQDFVDLCGEGEWFVGSRGGAGDHAAMKFGKRGYVSKISFFPFELKREIPFPEGYKLVIADSGVLAKKSSNAKDLFNQRIAEYEISFDFFRKVNYKYNNRIERLRDINPENLGCTPSELYEMLKKVPEYLCVDEIIRTLGNEYREKIELLSRSHTVPDSYRLRSVLLYGICECRRSARAADLLDAGEIESFGKLMYISHDGDRITRKKDQKREIYESRVDDAYMDLLVRDLRSEDPERVALAQLENQPGGYACSVEETDLLVDIAASVPGVVGAQLSGAGLGGCVMILVRDGSIETLKRALVTQYYEPKHAEPAITDCVPVTGSGLIEL